MEIFKKRKKYLLSELLDLAKTVAKELVPGSALALQGELGAGKTTFTSKILSVLAGKEIQVRSPTFTYVQSYDFSPVIHHFDIYRLPSKKAFIDLGFQQYFNEEGICIVEWADKILSLLPKNTLLITLEHASTDARYISIERLEL